MNENAIVLWNQDGVETTFEKVFSIEIEGERYIMLSPIESEFCRKEENGCCENDNRCYESKHDSDCCDSDEILVFKLKDGDHGELLVHLKEEECNILKQKCRVLIEKFINNYS